jgi:hypothetical protein
VTFSPPSPALTIPPVDNTAVKNGTITVTNTGSGPLTLAAAATVARVSGSGAFAVAPGTTGTPCAASVVIAAGSSCTLNVQYTPPATGSVASIGLVMLQDTGAVTTSQNSATFTAN